MTHMSAPESGFAGVSPATPSLILDLLEWLAIEPRSYAEVMEAWRTSCPRLSIWEDAVDGGYAVRTKGQQGEIVVAVTPLGRRVLDENGRSTRPLDEPIRSL